MWQGPKRINYKDVIVYVKRREHKLCVRQIHKKEIYTRGIHVPERVNRSFEKVVRYHKPCVMYVLFCSLLINLLNYYVSIRWQISFPS